MKEIKKKEPPYKVILKKLKELVNKLPAIGIQDHTEQLPLNALSSYNGVTIMLVLCDVLHEIKISKKEKPEVLDAVANLRNDSINCGPVYSKLCGLCNLLRRNR